ncbi:uncharacterized protein EV422DRAFT_511255 [Fimicolochytrium jonesii]|uniref:uncharacterized protein n=1 Tax=Fimicolochytrium jonesii TaxID=1396493 RepID=UPI0022FDB1B2|nr:uncharacterized protein EV422DRAFT_511255 [Fimicolochytrium jonesii]KAI8826745.1 hypothetical protein EV422DRAFT_511255 [Fimicolochytrium jonesii]
MLSSEDSERKRRSMRLRTFSGPSRVLQVIALLFALGLQVPTILAGNLTLSCHPHICPASIRYNDTVTITAAWTPTTPNTVLQSVALSYSLYYVLPNTTKGTTPHTISYTGPFQLKVEGSNNLTLSVSPRTQLNMTQPLPVPAVMKVTVQLRENNEHDGTFAGGGLLDGPIMVVRSANGSVFAPPTPKTITETSTVSAAAQATQPVTAAGPAPTPKTVVVVKNSGGVERAWAPVAFMVLPVTTLFALAL